MPYEHAPSGRTDVRFAFADPPYLGTSKFDSSHHYGAFHPDAGDCRDPEWHRALIQRLVTDFADGWVLCLSTPSLHAILPMCPTRARIGAWVKPFASFKPNVNPAYTWEPVIFAGGRKRDRLEPTVKDHHSESITLKKGLAGVKPGKFNRWVIDLMGAQPGDEFEDLFPGSGGFGDAWKAFCGTPPNESEGLFADPMTAHTRGGSDG